MVKLAYDEIEWVGFDGKTLVECGYARPIIREKTEIGLSRYFKISRTGNSLAIEYRPLGTEEDLLDLYKEGRLTLLKNPIPPPSEGDTVIYATSELFLQAGVSLPSAISASPLVNQAFPIWEPLAEQSGWAAWGNENKIKNLLNEWGRLLLKRATAFLRDYVVSNSRDEKARAQAEHVMEIARAASSERKIRQLIHLRHALAVRLSGIVEDIETLYELTRHDFDDPKWDLLAFEQQLDQLEVALRRPNQQAASATNPIVPTSASATQFTVVPSDTKIVQDYHALLRSLANITNPYERMKKCELASSGVLSRPLTPRPEPIERIVQALIANKAWIKLNQEDIPFIASEPIFYDPDVIDISSTRQSGVLLSLVEIRPVADRYKNAGIDPGPITSLLLDTINRNPLVPDNELTVVAHRTGGRS